MSANAQIAQNTIQAAQQAIDRANNNVSTIKRGLDKWNEQIEKKTAQEEELNDKIVAARTEKSRIASTINQEGSRSQRAKGEGCMKKVGGLFGDGRDNDCVRANRQRQVEQDNLISNYMITIKRLQREVANARSMKQQAEIEMRPLLAQIALEENKMVQAQSDLNRAKAEYEQGKALNNVEALQARARLADEERKKQTELQQKLNELQQLKNQQQTKDLLIEQESQALQASADLQKSSMPMVIGFIGLVVLSFIIQPMLKKQS